MVSKNKFGFAPLETKAIPTRAERSVGPMGAAVREAAESLNETTEAKIEQRRQNAVDAKAFRAAQDEGRVLQSLSLAEISTDDLPRDRMALEAVASSDEMEELKASIRERGQKEPVEVYEGPDGRYQLKKGWRRYTALSQLFAETGEGAFGVITARIEAGQADRLARYIDMVEENVIREDLTFAEMAQVAITAADDGGIDEADPAMMVGRLYGSLHKTKRSYIRSFVFLLTSLGASLQWPKDLPRNLGLDVSRALKSGRQPDTLRDDLARAGSAEKQNAVLVDFLKAEGSPEQPVSKPAEPKQKFEFFVGRTKITARNGECRIVSESDYATIPKERLEEAVRAFEAALKLGGKVRQS